MATVASRVESRLGPTSNLTRTGPRYAGIRYLSRVDTDWECWAVFNDHTALAEQERRPLERDMPPLERIAAKYTLRVY